MSEPDQIFDSVWDAIEDTPEEAADMKARAALLIPLTQHIRNQHWTHADAAARLDLPESRIKDLIEDRIWLFSQEELAELCRRAGCPFDLSGSETVCPDEGEALHRQLE